MTAPIDITQITPPRVPFFDPRNGLISREWYMFFLNIYTKIAGSSASLEDLQLAPYPEEITAQLSQLVDVIRQELETFPSSEQLTQLVDTIRQELETLPPSAQVGVAIDAIRQELQTLPPVIRNNPAGEAMEQTAPFPEEVVAQLAQLVDIVRQELQTMPKPDLGTMAGVQQDNVAYIGWHTGNVPTDIHTSAGTMYWDSADNRQTTSLIMNGGTVTQPIGESQYFRVKASVAITAGQVVMYSGTTGTTGGLTAAPATGLTAATASYVLGIAAESISLNAWGYIIGFGLITNLNTTGGAEAWVDGQKLYLDAAVTGGLTKTLPTAPNPKAFVCTVVYANATTGALFAQPSAGGIFGQQEGDVQVLTAIANDLIQRNGGNTSWVNVAPSTVSVGIATNLAGGAANRIPYQTAAATTSFIVAPTISNTFLEWSGSAFQWTANPLGTVTTVSVVTANGFAGTVATATTTPAITITTTITGVLKGNGTTVAAAVVNTDYLAPAAPVTKSADFSVAVGETWLINNKSGSTCTVTLPAAASWSGRQIMIQNYQAQTVISNASNVVALGGGAAATAILPAIVGSYITLVSDATNWITMQYSPNNSLLLE